MNGADGTAAAAQAAGADGASGHDGTPPPSPVDSLKLAAHYFSEFKEYARHYVAAKTAKTKLTIRRIVMLAALGAVGFLIVGASLVSATVLLLVGASNAIGSAFTPPKPWVGQIFIGLVFIIGTLVASLLVLRKFNSVSRRQTIASFEARRRREREKFGQDTVDRAKAAPFATTSKK